MASRPSKKKKKRQHMKNTSLGMSSYNSGSSLFEDMVFEEGGSNYEETKQ